MENVKYVCPDCGYESVAPGSCPGCQVQLIASCPLCGNPMIGEHVHPEG